jgi:hypothetical protein
VKREEIREGKKKGKMAEIGGRKNERNRDREERTRKGNHKKGMKAERAEVRKGQGRRTKKKLKDGGKDEIANENKEE